MNLTEFRSILTQHQEKPFRLQLPRGADVPVAFHITEASHVAKKFIDCGGRVHVENTIQFQAWVGGDEDHRLTAPKLLGIIDIAGRAVFPPNADELPVEIEYEDGLISQYPVENYTIADGAVVLHLAARHTDCLAKDMCVAPRNTAKTEAASCCCGGKC